MAGGVALAIALATSSERKKKTSSFVPPQSDT
jgi:hypothetical protein